MKLEDLKNYMVTNWSTCKLAFAVGVGVGVVISALLG